MLFINHREIYDGNTVLIELKGPLNTVTSPDFEYYINQLIEKNKNFIILDARLMEYVSSEGIGVMLFIQKKLSSTNGFFVICNLPTEIMVLYRLLGFDRVLTIAHSPEDALHIIEKQMEMRESPQPVLSSLEEVPVDMKHEAAREAGPPDEESGQALSLPAGDSEALPEFQNPLIVECAQCRELVRVKRGGTYECPYCHTEFTVEKDQTIIF